MKEIKRTKVKTIKKLEDIGIEGKKYKTLPEETLEHHWALENIKDGKYNMKGITIDGVYISSVDDLKGASKQYVDAGDWGTLKDAKEYTDVVDTKLEEQITKEANDVNYLQGQIDNLISTGGGISEGEVDAKDAVVLEQANTYTDNQMILGRTYVDQADANLQSQIDTLVSTDDAQFFTGEMVSTIGIVDYGTENEVFKGYLPTVKGVINFVGEINEGIQTQITDINTELSNKQDKEAAFWKNSNEASDYWNTIAMHDNTNIKFSGLDYAKQNGITATYGWNEDGGFAHLGEFTDGVTTVFKAKTPYDIVTKGYLDDVIFEGVDTSAFVESQVQEGEKIGTFLHASNGGVNIASRSAGPLSGTNDGAAARVEYSPSADEFQVRYYTYDTTLEKWTNQGRILHQGDLTSMVHIDQVTLLEERIAILEAKLDIKSADEKKEESIKIDDKYLRGL